MFRIQSGEKWAAICYSREWCEDLDSETDLGNGTWVLRHRPFDLPSHFKERVGSDRFFSIDSAYLWLVVKMHSTAPHVSDNETELLSSKVAILRLALHTSIPLENEFCFHMTGGIDGNESRVTGYYEPFQYRYSPGLPMVAINNGVISQVRDVMTGLIALFGDESFMTVRRGFNAFWMGLREWYSTGRLHQFVRALDAIVRAWGNERFGARASLFAGVQAEVILRECYRMRNKTEHLDEILRVLPPLHSSAQDAYVLLRVRQMERLCRHVYKQLAISASHRDLFRNCAIESFWKKPLAERCGLWGPPLDITEVR